MITRGNTSALYNVYLISQSTPRVLIIPKRHIDHDLRAELSARVIDHSRPKNAVVLRMVFFFMVRLAILHEKQQSNYR